MNVFCASEFAPGKAWESVELATMDEIAVRMLWTNEPNVWHINKTDEVFVVLQGEVEMFYGEQDEEQSVVLLAGDSLIQGAKHEFSLCQEAGVMRMCSVPKEPRRQLLHLVHEFGILAEA